jgi:3-dehydroquinate synthetase
MAIECSLSVRLGLVDKAVEVQQNELLARFGLPTKLPDLSHDSVIEHVNYDKKILGNITRWILPVGIGRAVVSSNVNETDLIAVLKEHSF